MANKEDELMEQMKSKKAIEKLMEDLPGKRALVSRQVLIEVSERADAAKTEEEGKQIIEKFLKDVIEGNITPYH